MNHLRLLLILLFCFILNSAHSETLDENLSINEIKPNLYIVTHAYPWPANSLVSIMENGNILIIDTPYTPKAMKSVLNWIYKKFGKRNIKAVNTHFHIDRLGGNEALVKAGIPIYSSELTANSIMTRGRKSIDLLKSRIKDEKIKSYYLNFKYTPPTDIFDSKKGLTLTFGKEKAEIKYYGPGHSIDNLAVFLPDKKTIFGGCMILSLDAENAGNVSDGDINEWKRTIKKIDTNNYDLVIPGHGRAGGLELITHTEEILETSK